ncbi:MAG: lysine--tRNA ligase [Patescibacteria group bacterium]
MNRYPDSFYKSHSILQVISEHEDLVKDVTEVTTAGRVLARRAFGKIIFLDIQDFSSKIQCYAREDILGSTKQVFIAKQLKVGDVVGVRGTAFLPKSGEKSIKLTDIFLLSETTLPFPEKYHRLVDQEARYRQRYLDLIMNSDTRKIFQTRFLLLKELRRFLDGRGFIEVETPIFQHTPCGASANPFRTRHDAKGIDLYLRISPETYLKQLIVAGIDRVYEIGKNFRNEGVDPTHLQEFTMLEFYVSYWSYRENIVFVQELLREIIQRSTGGLSIPCNEITLDFGAEWSHVKYRDVLLSGTGIDVLEMRNTTELLAEMKRCGVEIEHEKVESLGSMVDKLYKRFVRPNLVQPTILMQHPAYLLPLARPSDEDPRVADSFQVLVNGWEIVKAYSELADPELQRSLLEGQSQSRKDGDKEAMFLDEDFLLSLKYGMPPVSGVGIGIDRLLAILTNQRNLNEVVLFPLMK